MLLQIPASRRGSAPPVVFHILPVIGSSIEFGRNPTRFLIKYREKYGDVFTFVILGQKLTAVLGPKGNKFVMGMKSEIFNAEDAYGKFTAPVFGKDVAFDVPNEVFKEQKRFLSFGLSHSNFRTYVGIIDEEVTSYLNTLLTAKEVAQGDNWKSFDAYSVLSTLNILASSRTLHGKEVRESIRSGSKVVSYYDELDGSLGPLTDHAQKQLSAFYLDIIQRRKERYKKMKDALTDPEEDSDLISALMKQSYRDGTPLQDHVIAHLMIALLMAGRHTIYLAVNQPVAEDLYAEQVKYFSSPNGILRPLVYDDIRTLPLMNAVIKETLRLQPPIHSVSRMVRQDTPVPADCGVLPKGQIIIPKGHVVTASQGVSQLDKQLWDDAEKWNPYRWLQGGDHHNAGKLESTDLGAYQPFGGGGHRCIGEQYAIMQLTIMVSCFIRAFEMRIDSEPKRKQFTTVTLPSNSNIYYRRRS
ncbi:cytochrome P450 [Gymnopus androsaceus JB14]|uniref:Cytochrome P450 n=1 Tax=Gymnopus androsaceus JB14 TaxID=1447944 RepID=A0A6A4HJI0_9AGAR|nr:cytochrome P450 [Gymnopus androsaceus JB14]